MELEVCLLGIKASCDIFSNNRVGNHLTNMIHSLNSTAQ